MDKWPKISIVTPSYNTGEFLELSIKSVLEQEYPNLEYIIIDGGSSDGTIDVIHKYEPYINYWESKQDKGQCHATNKGFARASGDIHYWLCCDDLLEKGALFHVAEQLHDISTAKWLVGSTRLINRRGRQLGIRSPGIVDKNTFFRWATNWIPTQSIFWNRAMWEKAGPFDECLHYVMDLALWEKMFRICPPIISHQILGLYRFHFQSKSFSSLDASRSERLKYLTQLVKNEWYAVLKEGSEDKIIEILREHAGLLEEASDCQAMLEKLKKHKIFGRLLKLWKRFVQPEFEL